MNEKKINFLRIDEEGFPFFGELRVQDQDVGAHLLEHIQMSPTGSVITELEGEDYIVEAFDEPFVAQELFKENSDWKINLPYDVEMKINSQTLGVDDWDRIHGLTEKNIPFVLSRKAQAALFEELTDYDDESIVLAGEKIKTPAWSQSKLPVETEKYWSDVYRTETPGWELNQPSPVFESLVPKLKLPKSRVLVLGCGSGNDAAFFAKQGHAVTAVDLSPEAIKQAKEKYGNFENLKFVEQDAFHFLKEHPEQFDLIIEHTFFCAIRPDKRNDLIQLWKRSLAHGGHLLGVFFTMEKRDQPPYGASEWELRERLKKSFQFVMWSRWRQSLQRRNGKELLIYAQKKEKS